MKFLIACIAILGVASAEITPVMPALPGIVPDGLTPVMPVLPGVVPDGLTPVMPVLPEVVPGFVSVMPTLPAGNYAVSEWTLAEIDSALQNPHTHPMLIPYLEDALNDIMMQLMQGTNNSPVATISLPQHVVDAINMPDLTPVMPVVPEVIPEGVMPVLPGGNYAVSEWTLPEVESALQNPNTHPMLIPYLEDALNDIMMQLMQGTNNPIATIALPQHVADAINMPDLTPVMPVVPEVIPGEIVPVMPVMPVLPPGIIEVTPVLPGSPVGSEQASSPLVQIILNIAA